MSGLASDSPSFDFSSWSRAKDGVTVQFVSASGERRTVVAQGMPPRNGPVSDEGVDGSLRRAVAAMESWPGEWKVEVISTPGTIYRDLQGSRVVAHNAQRHGFASEIPKEHATLPEPMLLARIGRLDLLA